MLVAKQVADLITLTRAALIAVFAWLGITRGADGLHTAVIMMLYSWTSDVFDGLLARHSSRSYRSWLGDHDLEVDMTVALGLLIYMLLAGYVPWLIAALYLLIWVLIFLFFGVIRSLGMLYQAPIYGWFIWTAIKAAPIYGLSIVILVAVIVILTWPRFPQEVIPGFLDGLQAINRKKH